MQSGAVVYCTQPFSLLTRHACKVIKTRRRHSALALPDSKRQRVDKDGA